MILITDSFRSPILDWGFLSALKFKYGSKSQAIARSLFNHEYIKSYLDNQRQGILD